MNAGSSLRISLRQMLLLVVLFALGCVALKYANAAWEAATSAVAILALMAATIVALVDRGPRQAFALGFAASLLIYGALVYACGKNGYNREIDPYAARLPTSIMMRPLFQKISVLTYVDFSTGKVLPNYKPPKNQPAIIAPSASSFAQPVYAPQPTSPMPPVVPAPATAGNVAVAAPAVAQFGTAMVGTMQSPSGRDFMVVAHYLWALLLGYVGGYFGKYIHARRSAEGSALSMVSS